MDKKYLKLVVYDGLYNDIFPSAFVFVRKVYFNMLQTGVVSHKEHVAVCESISRLECFFREIREEGERLVTSDNDIVWIDHIWGYLAVHYLMLLVRIKGYVEAQPLVIPPDSYHMLLSVFEEAFGFKPESDCDDFIEVDLPFDF